MAVVYPEVLKSPQYATVMYQQECLYILKAMEVLSQGEETPVSFCYNVNSDNNTDFIRDLVETFFFQTETFGF